MPKHSKNNCLADVRERILATDLAPGTDLDEVSLSEHYGVSRTPLREVLQRLAGDGYIRLESNRGAKVASMDFATMRTFFQTAPLIYASIARLAAENRTTKQLRALMQAQAEFRQATEAKASRDAAFANHRFHATIGDMAHNKYLRVALERLLIDHTRMSQTFYRPTSSTEAALIRKAGDQHDEMIAAIEAADPGLATELTLRHWDLSRDRMDHFVRPDPLPVDVVSLKDRRNAV